MFGLIILCLTADFWDKGNFGSYFYAVANSVYNNQLYVLAANLTVTDKLDFIRPLTGLPLVIKAMRCMQAIWFQRILTKG